MEANIILDTMFRAQGMTLLHWKSIKWVTYMAAVGLGFHVVHQGADPTVVIVIIGIILAGPELLEHIAINEGQVTINRPDDNTDDRSD